MNETNDIRGWIFTYRSYTPLPFLAVMLVFARPTVLSLVAGFTVLFVGEMIRFWGVSLAGSETRTTGRVGGTYLITNGPFAYVRNPLYVGNILMYLGVGIMSMALFPWLQIVALVWFVIQYTLIVTREEEYLAAKFGKEYSDYCAQVRRFLPRLTPYRAPGEQAKTEDAAAGIASERRTLQAIGLITFILVVIYVIRLG